MERFINLREKIVIGVLVLLLITGSIWRAVQVSNSGPEIIQAGYSDREVTAEIEETEMVTVHLVGAVVNPGIYQLPAGSRIYELINLSGGFNDEADQDILNQARPILDGEQIHVHKIGEAPKSLESSTSNKININRATASELTALPGIGDVRANQIVAHREKHGYFTSIEQIMDVSGIGENTFNNIAEKITIY